MLNNPNIQVSTLKVACSVGFIPIYFTSLLIQTDFARQMALFGKSNQICLRFLGVLDSHNSSKNEVVWFLPILWWWRRKDLLKVLQATWPLWNISPNHLPQRCASLSSGCWWCWNHHQDSGFHNENPETDVRVLVFCYSHHLNLFWSISLSISLWPSLNGISTTNSELEYGCLIDRLEWQAPMLKDTNQKWPWDITV